MDRQNIYNKSAFKHGFSKADIEWAFMHPIRNGLLEDYDNKYLLVGFDTRGNPIEVMYNRIDNERVNVFHAMKCRKEFLPYDDYSHHFFVGEKPMTYMSESEADALDEELTHTTPKVDFSKPDIFMRQRDLLNVLNPHAADYIISRALATHKTPARIISELVGEKIAQESAM
jgi:hypothetical protein